jgi:hypothetical protein
MTPAEIDAEPLSGSIFAARVDVAGIAEPFITL